jgi:OmcA/MtrC family decaheme c-type cytochrome
MHTSRNKYLGLVHFYVVCALTLGLAGCSGDDGAPGAPGAPGPSIATLADATALNITITGASVGSPPVVSFSVTNQDGVAVAGFAETDLRFNIAKLIPGAPSRWQNYINRASSGAVQGSQERSRTGYPWGTLVDNKNGTFTYTFATDITNAAATCPAPCTDADGVALDTSYQPTLTHRVTIQQSNTALPKANATYDFVPAGGAVSTTREIVKTATCNECHNQLVAHGSRIETKLCVTCHNPGSWVAGVAGTTPNTPVDFKVMIHKIHQGEELPSVKAGTPYAIGSADFSTVVFPYSAFKLGDTRACAKCHDGAVTAQGDNWKNQPSKAACSSCHDDVYFGTSPDPLKTAYQTVSHMTVSANAGAAAPADPADSTCITCHGAGQVADLVVKHDLPNLLKAEGAKYQFNILTVTNTGPGQSPQITFSITNPADGSKYDLKTDTRLSAGSISLLVGWNNTDENNAGSTSNPAQPLTVGLTGSSAANAADNGNLTYTVDLALVTLGTGVTNRVIPASMTGSGRVAIYGRASVDVDGDTVKDTVRIKAAYKDYAITDATPVARRQVVDIAKCDKCHDQVSLHGDSRTNEPGLCVICHNPNATDVTRRPKTGGIPDPTLTLDTKKEEAIDFKRLIHGIHAAAKTDYPVAPATVGVTAHGFRNKGLVVWGYPGAASCLTGGVYTCQNDFSDVRFPGILNDCSTCHTTKSVSGTTYGTYELVGTWEVPTQSGVLGSTIDTAPAAVDAATLATGLATNTDDLNITPTAAVCSSCHDGDVARSHMTLNGALFSATQATINTGATLEACAICHGPGRIADVKVIHGAK